MSAISVSPLSPSAYAFHPAGPQFALSSSTRPPPEPKRKRKRISNGERKAICQYRLEHPRDRHQDIASKFGVDKMTVSKILSKKDHWQSVELGDAVGCGPNGTGLPFELAKRRAPSTPSIESGMLKWLAEASNSHYTSFYSSLRPDDLHAPVPVYGPLSDASLREKAREIARSNGLEETFKASSGWLHSFKKRHGIKNGLWPGYLGHVQGRNAVGTGLGSSSTASVPFHRYRITTKTTVSHSDGEDKDDGDSDADTEDSSHPQPPPALSTSTSGDSLLNQHRQVCDDRAWFSSSNPSHQASTLPEPLFHSESTDTSVGYHAYSTQYPSSDLRHETSQNEQPGRVLEGNSLAPIEYEHSMHSDMQMLTRPHIPDLSMPTLAECEDYLSKLVYYVDDGPGQGILSLRRREWLRKIKIAFFERGSGIPITPDSDEEGL